MKAQVKAYAVVGFESLVQMGIFHKAINHLVHRF